MIPKIIVLKRGRVGSYPLLFTVTAVCVALLDVGVLGRTPSAFSDSDLGMLDTRIGTAFVAGEDILDTRTGSLATSNLRGLNTTKLGSCIYLR